MPDPETNHTPPPTSPLLASAAPPGSTIPDFKHAVGMILERLAAEPDAAATLLPGFIVLPAPMTPATRAALFLPRANEKRRANNQERLLKVKQVIAEQLDRNAAMSDYNLAAALNDAGLHTYRGLPFSATRVRTLLIRMKRATPDQIASRSH